MIELLECKRLEEIGHLDDSKSSKYHRIINHPMEKCFVLKDIILRLVKEWNIKLDIGKFVNSNPITIVSQHLLPLVKKYQLIIHTFYRLSLGAM